MNGLFSHNQLCLTFNSNQNIHNTRFQKEEVKEDKSKTQNLTTTTSNGLPSKVLLQTATTHAYAQHSGTQRSYATNHLKKRLGLRPVKKKKLNFNTFGQDKFTKQKCDMVTLNLKGQ